MSVPARLAPRVIAGLITAPENIPSTIMTIPTIPPKASATSTSVESELRPGAKAVRMIDAGPMVTKR